MNGMNTDSSVAKMFVHSCKNFLKIGSQSFIDLGFVVVEFFQVSSRRRSVSHAQSDQT